MDDNTDEYGAIRWILTASESFAELLKINYKNIEVTNKELENLNKELFAKGIECGVPGWYVLTMIQSHVKNYIKVIESYTVNKNIFNKESKFADFRQFISINVGYVYIHFKKNPSNSNLIKKHNSLFEGGEFLFDEEENIGALKKKIFEFVGFEVDFYYQIDKDGKTIFNKIKKEFDLNSLNETNKFAQENNAKNIQSWLLGFVSVSKNNVVNIDSNTTSLKIKELYDEDKNALKTATPEEKKKMADLKARLKYKHSEKDSNEPNDGNSPEGAGTSSVSVAEPKKAVKDGEDKESSEIINEFKNKIKQLYSDEKYQAVVEEAELAEILYEDFFKDSFIANIYLWSLMVRDLEKAFKEIDRIKKITSDKIFIQDAVGMIYAKKGDENNDLNLLNKALQCFQLYDYSDKEIGTKRINYVQKLLIQNKLKALGLTEELQEQFKNGNYTKLWKANCYLSEPTYLKDLKGNLKIETYRDSNVNFYVPSNAILKEQNAIAFIKANWKSYEDFICDKSWRSNGYKYNGWNLVDFDKRKIEIIEISEIVFN